MSDFKVGVDWTTPQHGNSAHADLEATISEQAAEIERLTRQRDELLAAIADHIGSIDPESENRAYDDLRSAYDIAKGGA